MAAQGHTWHRELRSRHGKSAKDSRRRSLALEAHIATGHRHAKRGWNTPAKSQDLHAPTKGKWISVHGDAQDRQDRGRRRGSCAGGHAAGCRAAAGGE